MAKTTISVITVERFTRASRGRAGGRVVRTQANMRYGRSEKAHHQFRGLARGAGPHLGTPPPADPGPRPPGPEPADRARPPVVVQTGGRPGDRAAPARDPRVDRGSGGRGHAGSGDDLVRPLPGAR